MRAIDWFNNREKEIQRLRRRIEDCLPKDSSTVVMPEPGAPQEIPEEVVTTVPGVAARARDGIQLDEARQRLLALRDNKVLPACSDVTRSILRKDMLEALLVDLPTSAEEFRELIPLKYREQTDADQMKFLSEILAILARVEE